MAAMTGGELTGEKVSSMWYEEEGSYNYNNPGFSSSTGEKKLVWIVFCACKYWNVIYLEWRNHLYFFHKKLGSGPIPQSCLHFHGFRGFKLLNGCLVIWLSITCVYDEHNMIFMISAFKIFPMSDSQTVVYCRFNSYFAFISKEKLHFCLVKKDWSLKIT